MNTAPTCVNFTLNQDQPTLVLIQQYDAALEAHSCLGIHAVPGPRFQTIVILLPAGSGQLNIDIKPKYHDGTNQQFSYVSKSIRTSSPDYLIAQNLHKFQLLWQKGDEESLSSAVSELETVSNIEGASARLLDLVQFNLGLLYYQQFKFELARDTYANLSASWWRTSDRAASSCWALGAVALEQAELELARAHLELSLKYANLNQNTETNLLCDKLETQLYLGLVLMRQGEVDKGFALLNQSIEVARGIGSNILLGKLNINLGGYYEFYREGRGETRIHNHEFALKHYQSAFETLAITAIVSDAVTAQLNIGRLKVKTGELSEALDHFQNALDLNRRQHNKVIRSYLYANLGGVYQMLGDFSRAKHYLQRSFDLREQSGAKRFQIRDGLTLGRLERITGELDKAIAHHAHCKAFYIQLGAPKEIAEANYELAEDYYANGLHQQSLSHLEEAKVILQQTEDSLLGLKIERLRALCLLESGNPFDANMTITSVLAVARKSPIAPEVIETLFVATKIAMQTEPEQALVFANEAAKLAESTRGQFETSRLGTNFSAKVHEVFVLLALLHLRHAQDSDSIYKAIDSLERGRATAFALADVQTEKPSDNFILTKKSLSLLSEERINNFDNGINAPDAEDAYFEALDMLGRLLPTTATPTETSDYKVSAMQPHHATLYYITHAEFAYCLALLPDGPICYAIKNARQLSAMIKAAHEDIESNNFGGLTDLADMIVPASLRQKLESLGSVTIIPHGPLHNLPFSALVTAGGKPLFQGLPISLSYSLQSQSQTDPGDVPQSLAMAIFADPDFSNEIQTGLRSWASNLERLPWTAEEARSIQSTFRKSKCLSFTDNEANRNNLLNGDVKSAKILHIATHGFYNSKLSDVVGIALSSSNGESGFVGLTDLLQEGFRNELVVISGCETGQGELLQGEGNLSLARAFLVQGVKNVISTLWPVADRTSALFMRFFYEALKHNENPAAALVAAQDQLRQTDRYSHPKHWAGYQLHTRQNVPRLSGTNSHAID